jgi:hypothetical protein
MRLLHDIVKSVSDKVNLPCTAIYAKDEGEFNVELDEAIGLHSRVLMFKLPQDAQIQVTGSLYGYIDYNNSKLMFLTTPGSNDTDEDRRAKITQMVQMAFEWITWLRRDPSWLAHPLNNQDLLNAPFAEIDGDFDADVVGVAITLNIRIDPFFDTSNLC